MTGGDPTSQHGYFTTTYFHRPEEVQDEIEAAGLAHLATLPVEGIGWLTETTDERSKAEWGDPVKRQRLLELVAAVEGEQSLLDEQPPAGRGAAGVKRGRVSCQTLHQ